MTIEEMIMMKNNHRAEKKRKDPKASLCRAKSSMLGTIERSSRENTCVITIISSFDNEHTHDDNEDTYGNNKHTHGDNEDTHDDNEDTYEEDFEGSSILRGHN